MLASLAHLHHCRKRLFLKYLFKGGRERSCITNGCKLKNAKEQRIRESLFTGTTILTHKITIKGHVCSAHNCQARGWSNGLQSVQCITKGPADFTVENISRYEHHLFSIPALRNDQSSTSPTLAYRRITWRSAVEYRGPLRQHGLWDGMCSPRSQTIYNPCPLCIRQVHSSQHKRQFSSQLA